VVGGDASEIVWWVMCMITQRFREKTIIIGENIKEKQMFYEKNWYGCYGNVFFSTFR
jgi:hypothetical protein